MLHTIEFSQSVGSCTAVITSSAIICQVPLCIRVVSVVVQCMAIE